MRAAGLILHVFLLLVVAGEVLFLAATHRERVDLTADAIYSRAPVTLRMIERLEAPLRIEAYFTNAEKLTSDWRDGRRALDNFLDELVQTSRGMITVDYIDPNDDPAVVRRAQRLGIQQRVVQQREDGQASATQVWQGLRLRYATRTEIVPLIAPWQCNPYSLERIVTPAIKRLLIDEPTRIAFMEWPVEMPPVQRGAPRDSYRFVRVRRQEALAGRYQWVDLTAAKGILVPEGIELLVLFRPHAITERQQYVIDQHIMRGGRVAVFVDAHLISYLRTPRNSLIGIQPFSPQPYFGMAMPGTPLDRTFLAQLDSYGVEVREKVLSDAKPQAWDTFGGYVVTANGPRLAPFALPYLFRPLNVDWSESAQEVAKFGRQRVDPEAVTWFEENLGPGIDPDHPINQNFLRTAAPAFYFPTPLDLDPPEGVEAEVVMQTSPYTFEETVSPGSPLGWLGPNAANWQNDYSTRNQSYLQKVVPADRRQVPLVVELRGSFPSFFRGREIPLRPGQTRKEPSTGNGENGGPEIGPSPQAPAAEDKDADPPTIEVAPPDAQLVVIGDTDFVRDDLVGGVYGGAGSGNAGPGPFSRMGETFFANLIEYLTEDTELQELRDRGLVDRSLEFVARDMASEGQADYQRRAQDRAFTWQMLNLVAPIAVLLSLAALVWLRRRRQKRRFLASTRQLGGSA